jgi:disulfide bond formation protein DsbB
MTLDAYSTILVSGSIAMFAALLGACMAYFASLTARKKLRDIPYEYYLSALAAISLIAIAGSLTYQLVYLTPVCELCWWQRIFLYPVSVITLVALWYKTRETHVTVAILAAFGLWYALYHYYYHFQGFVLGNTLTLPCSYGGLMPACTDSPILVFGFATIPFMGIMVFGSILMLSGLAFGTLYRTHSK